MEDFVSGFHNLNGEDALDPREAIHSFSVPISLFGLIGNAIVLWYLCFRIHRNPFTSYILNLAVNDLLFLITFSIAAIIFFIEFHGLIRHDLHCEILEVIYMFGFINSKYLLTALSVEGCLSVWYPVWYRCRRHKHQSAVVCAVVWLLSFVLTVSWFFVCAYESHGCFLLHVAQAVLDCLMSIPLMLLSSLALLITICRSSQRHQQPRLYFLLLTTVLNFLILAVPPKLLLFLHSYFGTFAVAVLCFCLNISLNPIIYFLVGSLKKWQIKSSIQVALQTAFQDEPDLPLQEETAPVQCPCLPASSAL